MSRAGYGSRRESERLIAANKVVVNGRVAKLGDKADPQLDTISVDGKTLKFADQSRIYIKLYKPRGVISSLEDELDQDRRIVRDLIPTAGHIYPVGRLDKQSEGLMLMTNDGSLAHRLTHPRYEHPKVYEVNLEGSISDENLSQWRRGVLLDDRVTAPADIQLIKRTRTESSLRITMREGRKRQIRRVAAAFGHPVRRLVRTAIGPLKLGEMKPGEWRHLNEEELQLLRESTTLSQNKNKTGNKQKKQVND
jgi:23S rRNA pseudouridine2605 synthase